MYLQERNKFNFNIEDEGSLGCGSCNNLPKATSRKNLIIRCSSGNNLNPLTPGPPPMLLHLS